MSSITIIEASRKNGIGTSNSSWVNTYQQPITIETGDVIQLKQCFVDTNANNDDNITFSEDQEIFIQMGYYLINSDLPAGKVFSGGGEEGDYQPYIARYANTLADQWEKFQPFLTDFQYTLPAGTYTPSGLAETLTRAFTKVTFRADLPNSSRSLRVDNPFMATTEDAGDNNENMAFYIQTATNATEATAKKFYFNNTADVVDITFYEPRIFIGSSEGLALIWNREGNSKFSIDYLHSPIIFEGSPAVKFVRKGDIPLKHGETGNYFMYNRRSGVFITDISPKSLWEDTLGFNITKGDSKSIIVSFDAVYDIDSNLDETQGIKTTGQFCGLTNARKNPGTKDGSMVSTLATNGTASGATFAIMSEKVYDPEPDGGFYILSISGFVNDFREDSSIRRNIFGILSKNYIQNGYITAYAESGVGWQNDGPPILLSNLKVEILDATTKEPVENIGENNSVFLEVIKAPPQKSKK